MPALPPDASVGLFGKLPARGDFVRENLPRDFTDIWDAWWQRGLTDTQRLHPGEWRAAWLEAPVWCFLLPPGLCGRNGVLGLWMPSVDKAGRYSPLTIAALSTGDWAPFGGTMASFLASAEQAGRDALEQDLSPAELQQRVQNSFVAGDAPTPEPDFVPGRAAWWTEGGPRVASRREGGSTLPEGSAFAAFIDDDWAVAELTASPSVVSTRDAV